VTKQSCGAAGDRDCHAALAMTQETITTIPNIYIIPWSVIHLSELDHCAANFFTEKHCYQDNGLLEE